MKIPKTDANLKPEKSKEEQIAEAEKDPSVLVIPIATLRKEKKRYITALNKFQPSAERSHAHGVLVGKIEVLEWLESEIEKKRPTP